VRKTIIWFHLFKLYRVQPNNQLTPLQKVPCIWLWPTIACKNDTDGAQITNPNTEVTLE